MCDFLSFKYTIDYFAFGFEQSVTFGVVYHFINLSLLLSKLTAARAETTTPVAKVFIFMLLCVLFGAISI